MVTPNPIVDRMSQLALRGCCWFGAVAGGWFWIIALSLVLMSELNLENLPGWLEPLDSIGFFEWRFVAVLVFAGVPIAAVGLALKGEGRRRLD